MRTGRPRTSVKERLLQRHVVRGDCWIYTGAKTRDGYGVLGVGRGNQVRAHRASYQAFRGPIQTGILVCHTCDTPLCIRPSHLFLGTPKDNTRDMIVKGRRTTLAGAKHPMAKLSDMQVHDIRRLRDEGRSLSSIAALYGITFQYVSALSKGISRGTR